MQDGHLRKKHKPRSGNDHEKLRHKAPREDSAFSPALCRCSGSNGPKSVRLKSQKKFIILWDSRVVATESGRSEFTRAHTATREGHTASEFSAFPLANLRRNRVNWGSAPAVAKVLFPKDSQGDCADAINHKLPQL
jgi:hypothetical protein